VSRSDEALRDLVNWRGSDELDTYPYVRDFFVYLLGYRKDWVRIGKHGEVGIPDISLCSKDAKPRDGVFWVVGEIKKEPGLFRDRKERRKCWDNQLKKYISGDTAYALLIDPTTIVVLGVDGTELQVVPLDKMSTKGLVEEDNPNSIAFLSFDKSISDESMRNFREGLVPHRFLDVTDVDTRDKFYEALRISSRELIGYSVARLKGLLKDHEAMIQELAHLDSMTTDREDPAYVRARKAIERRHHKARRLKEEILPAFESQIGRDVPTAKDEAERFILQLYATEGSSLILARILLVRFFEDHGLTTRKISNGGIKAFRSFYHDIKDDYAHLLSDAFKDLERRYSRLFEPSIFDWSHEGNGELSRLLLRIFYRLNAFDFTKVTGDIMGNLYERFLDVDSRKKLGEFYTPMPVAEYVLERIGFYDAPGTLLDPACGSGTFLIAAVEGLIKRLTARGVSTKVAVEQAIGLVHGLDINMFASFIAQLQLIWHLFPYFRQANIDRIPDLRIYGGVNSLTYDPQSTLFSSVLKAHDKGDEPQVDIRDRKYRYVVGNPPYIRNERFKDWGEWRNFYKEIDNKNSDIAFYFVKRAIDGGVWNKKIGPAVMPPWLEDGGRMCWVLPLGVCDSSAADPLRRKLLSYRVYEVVDMEDVAHAVFPSAMASTRATVAPVLLFAERAEVKNDATTRLVCLTKKCLKPNSLDLNAADVSVIPQSVFAVSAVNPFGQVLTKLKNDDLVILEKMMSFKKVTDYSDKTLHNQLTPIYGIKVGAAGRISGSPAAGLLPMLKGQNVSAFCVNETTSQWIDPAVCASASLWRRTNLSGKNAVAISEIALAPQAALFDVERIAFNNSAVLFLADEQYEDFPWDVLFNSSAIRFVYHLILRSGLIGVGTPVGGGKTAAWSHVYPRSLGQVPVPEPLVADSAGLEAYASKMRIHAANIGRRWDEVKDALDRAQKQSLAMAKVTWVGLTEDICIEGQPSVRRLPDRSVLHFNEEGQEKLGHIEGTYELLNVVSYIIQQRDGAYTKQDLENMAVPLDPTPISRLIDNAGDPNSPDIQGFITCMEKADEAIMDGFGLSKSEKAYLRKRISSPPFDVLEPRWPWTGAALRQAQEYGEDRFA